MRNNLNQIIREDRYKNGRPYVAMGYDFLRTSGGTRAIWLLVDELNKRGFEAHHDAVGEGKHNDESIVIWCEGLHNNPDFYRPRRTKRMVGWKLGDFGHFNREEIKDVFYYVPLYKDHPDDFRQLHVPIIDLNLFHNRFLPKKKKTCFWVGKGPQCVGNDFRVKHPECEEITYGHPLNFALMADLLRESDIMYAIDSNSSLLIEARLCGAIVVYANPEDKPGLVECTAARMHGMSGGVDGIAFNDSPEEIRRARETLPLFEEKYMKSIENSGKSVDDFIKYTQEVFK